MRSSRRFSTRATGPPQHGQMIAGCIGTCAGELDRSAMQDVNIQTGNDSIVAAKAARSGQPQPELVVGGFLRRANAAMTEDA